MAQFHVYRNLDRSSRERFPFLLDVQSDLLESLATRVVVPLGEADAKRPPVGGLMPVFEIDGRAVVMRTSEITGIACRIVGERVASLEHRRHEIVAALDVLISGV
ncbi:MAG: plasmid maintenance protein CcdB [Burkholderiales bacterium]|nr:CcdB family protein [Burkholderiaceae bacterium]MCD6674953.1 CcdB family protein [Burkholderiaceae bacterium]RIK99062.1 MAG: plasmid maintenance protein CcdB [Burkholderiales bacterium]